jgi:hypothetical protein
MALPFLAALQGRSARLRQRSLKSMTFLNGGHACPIGTLKFPNDNVVT